MGVIVEGEWELHWTGQLLSEPLGEKAKVLDLVNPAQWMVWRQFTAERFADVSGQWYQSGTAIGSDSQNHHLENDYFIEFDPDTRTLTWQLTNHYGVTFVVGNTDSPGRLIPSFGPPKQLRIDKEIRVRGDGNGAEYAITPNTHIDLAPITQPDAK